MPDCVYATQAIGGRSGWLIRADAMNFPGRTNSLSSMRGPDNHLDLFSSSQQELLLFVQKVSIPLHYTFIVSSLNLPADPCYNLYTVHYPIHPRSLPYYLLLRARAGAC